MLRLLFFVFIFSSCSQLEAPHRAPQVLKPVWTKNLDPAQDSGNLPIGLASPFIKDDVLYIGDLSGYFHAYDVETGKLIWEHYEKEAITGKANSFQDNIIYGTQYGRLFSRNLITGKLVYSTDLGAPIESAPVFHDGRLFLHLRNHQIMAIDATTGKILWSYKRSISHTTTLQRVSKPFIYKNSLIVGFADGYLGSLSVEEGVLNWEQKISHGRKFVDVDIDPILFHNRIVISSADGDLNFINPKNGFVEKTVQYQASHTPLILGDEMILGSNFGDIALFNKNGDIVKKLSLSKKGISNIKLFKNNFIITTWSALVFALDQKSLTIVDSFNLGSFASSVFGELEVKDDTFSFLSSRNRLYTFR